MGAIANMAPGDLPRASSPHVPFVDVVTTMLDETIPLTTNEFDEWGNPKETEYYDYMLSYSPYDNVQAQDYPAMLVTTGLWDSQVQYFEPAKWVARLRARKTDANPLLFHTTMEAGHGGKSGRFQRYREIAARPTRPFSQKARRRLRRRLRATRRRRRRSARASASRLRAAPAFRSVRTW